MYHKLKVLIRLLLRWALGFAILAGLVVLVNSLQNSETAKQILGGLDSELFYKIENLSILAGLIAFAFEIPNQRKRLQYEAWQVINSAQGQGGSGGRIQALQDLNANQVGLAGLTAPEAYLTEVKLSNADLVRANLQDAVLVGANLQNANLQNANLQSANLFRANLLGANLFEANLQNAVLVGANLQNANLQNANLQNANLFGANLLGANLFGANLQNALWHDGSVTIAVD